MIEKKKLNAEKIPEQGLADDLHYIENEIYNWLIMSAYQSSSNGTKHKERKKKNTNHKSKRKTK